MARWGSVFILALLVVMVTAQETPTPEATLSPPPLIETPRQEPMPTPLPPTETPTSSPEPTLTETPTETSTSSPEPTLTTFPTEPATTSPEATTAATLTSTEMPTLTDQPIEAPSVDEIELTPSLTPIPTITETLTATPTIIDLTLGQPYNSFTSFDTDSAGFVSLAPSQVTAGLTGNGAHVLPGFPLRFNQGHLQNTIAQLDVLIDSGGLIWQTNASALGAYNLEITHKGLTLYRGQQPVIQTKFTMIGWTRIQWLAVDGVVRVAVNQLPILTYVDPTPLPGGTVQLFTLSGSALVDNISLAGMIQPPTAQLESEMLQVAGTSNSQIEFSVQSMSTGNTAWIGFIYQTFISVEYDIQIIKPDGTLRTTLWTGNMFTTFVNDAQVSPDGSKVILTTNSSGSYRTYLLNTAAPYNYRRADTINDLQTRVQWANDGQGYYYTNGFNIYYMPLAGGVPPTTVFTKPASCDVIHDFVLSRDYSHSTQTGSLIFESDCQPNSIIEVYMWQVAATGGTPIDVTASPPVWALSIRGSEWLSPDQTQIVNGQYSGLSGTSDIVRLLASNRNFLATVISPTVDVSFTQLSWGGSDAIVPTPVPSFTPMPSPTPSPSPTATATPDPIAVYSQFAISRVSAQQSCLAEVLDREVVGGGNIQGSGTYAQAYAIAWAVMNNIALTAYLDDGRRHGNNSGVVYCTIGSVSPCDTPGYVSPNSEVNRAITDVLNNYQWMSLNDPTDGSLQWRHIPNDGWSQFDPNMMYRQPGESAEALILRHANAATLYASQVDVGGRIYFPPSISLQDVQQGNPNFGHNYPDVTWLVRTLSVFNPNTNLYTLNFSAANLYIIITFGPPSGTSPISLDSCS